MQPFRAVAKEGPATLPEAARQASIAHAQNNVDASTSTQTTAPSKMQSDWVHLVSDEVLKIRLTSMPDVQRSLLQMRHEKAESLVRAQAASSERKVEPEPPSDTQEKREVKTADDEGLSSSSSFEKVDEAGKSASNGQTEQVQHGGAPAAGTHAEVPMNTTHHTEPAQQSETS